MDARLVGNSSVYKYYVGETGATNSESKPTVCWLICQPYKSSIHIVYSSETVYLQIDIQYEVTGTSPTVINLHIQIVYYTIFHMIIYTNMSHCMLLFIHTCQSFWAATPVRVSIWGTCKVQNVVHPFGSAYGGIFSLSLWHLLSSADRESVRAPMHSHPPLSLHSSPHCVWGNVLPVYTYTQCQ